MPKKVVTKCPVCGAPLRVSVRSDELGIIYEGSDDTVCNRISDCEHYKWVRVSRGCLEHPDDPACKGVEEVLEEAIDKVYGKTTVWLLIPNIADFLKSLKKAYNAVVEVDLLLVFDERLKFLCRLGVRDEVGDIKRRLAGLLKELEKKYFRGV